MPVASDAMWKWLRREISTDAFTTWLYDSRDAEAQLGRDLYVELLSLHFDDQRAELESLRERLLRERPRSCLCTLFCDNQVIPLIYATRPDALLPRFHVVRELAKWVLLLRCKACSQNWYVTLDTSADDWYFRRLLPEDAAAIEHGPVLPATDEDYYAFWMDRKAQREPVSSFNIGLGQQLVDLLSKEPVP